MTSKEEKQHYVTHVNEMVDIPNGRCYFSLTPEQEEQILRDLEVLEILKRIDWLVYNNGDKNDFNWYIDTNKSMKLTKEEANKVKEWLDEI